MLFMELEEIKKEYSKYEKKYSLPSFKELNECFELEKIEYKTEILPRVIRKMMMDKLVNSIGFLDMLLNPVQAPRIYLSFIKSMSQEDKKIIEALYDSFGKISLDCMPLELDYSEKAEAQMINHIYKVWDESKEDFKALLVHVGNPTQNTSKKEKSYFG